MKIVVPSTYLIGATTLDRRSLNAYLSDTGQTEFLDALHEAEQATVDRERHNPALADAEIICSFYAKLCYRSLAPGHNLNLTGTRSIRDNLRGTISMGHGSVLEHTWFNFVTTRCSRVFTHEMVRHRVGTAFSQTSGRYVRSDKIEMVNDPILSKNLSENTRDTLQDAMILLERGMASANAEIESLDLDRDTKKKMTSALRRYLPNGQANELGWSMNARQLRHWLLLRSAAGAEKEIRLVANQVYDILSDRVPSLLFDAIAGPEDEDGLFEVKGMKAQPYERMNA
jgi:thymidylate synthase (FAD)